MNIPTGSVELQRRWQNSSAWVDPFCARKPTKVMLLSQKQLLQIALHWLGTEGQYRFSGDMRRVCEASVCIPVFISESRW